MVCYCRLVLEFELIPWAFGKFPIVVTLWLSMSMSTVLIVYPLFNYWANNRKPGPASKCVVLTVNTIEVVSSYLPICTLVTPLSFYCWQHNLFLSISAIYPKVHNIIIRTTI